MTATARANPFAAALARIRPATEAEAAEARRRDRGPVARDLLRSWDLPAMSLAQVRERVQDQRLLAAVDQWRWGSPSLLLCGETGAGKTMACSAGVRRLLVEAMTGDADAWDRAQRICWADAAELGQARRQHGYGKGEAPEVDRAMRAPLLVLDDLGWEQDAATVRDVVAARYKRGLPMWTTTGRTVAELRQSAGDAVLRRLVECRGQRGAVVEVGS